MTRLNRDAAAIAMRAHRQAAVCSRRREGSGVNHRVSDSQAATTQRSIAGISGTDPKLKDEVVMLGSHLDSWSSGTSATDNGAGSVVAMEVMRILNALQLKPRRTIRIALWSSEEQGLFGSAGYVTQHFGSYPRSTAPDQLTLPEFLRKPAGPLQLQNLQKNPTITIKVGKEERTIKAQALVAATNVGSVIQSFQEKYKPEMIAKYYPGPLDAAIKLTL